MELADLPQVSDAPPRALTIVCGRVGIDAGMAFVEANHALLRQAFGGGVSFLCINEHALPFPLPLLPPLARQNGNEGEDGDENDFGDGDEEGIRVFGAVDEYLALQSHLRQHWLAARSGLANHPQLQIDLPTDASADPTESGDCESAPISILCDVREIMLDPLTALPNDLSKAFSVRSLQVGGGGGGTDSSFVPCPHPHIPSPLHHLSSPPSPLLHPLTLPPLTLHALVATMHSQDTRKAAGVSDAGRDADPAIIGTGRGVFLAHLCN